MSIKIQDHYRPYTQLPGTSVMLPSSSWYITAYPTRFELKSIDPSSASASVCIELVNVGPVRGFTVMQNLDRGWVRISGHSEKGYLSYRILASGHEVILFMERCPNEGVTFKWNNTIETLKRKEECIFPITYPSFNHHCPEKIHFGCHKAQNWPLLKNRLTLAEVLPLYFEIGKNMTPSLVEPGGTMMLLYKCLNLVEEKNRVMIGAAILDLFRASFDGIFVPRLEDHDYLGLIDSAPDETFSSIALLSEGAAMIRSLFIQLVEDTLYLLPCLPVELHAGRFCKIQASNSLSLDIEWSKKMLRRVALHCHEDQTIRLKLPPDTQSFRISPHRSKQQGKKHLATEPLVLSKGQSYLLDRFQK